MLLYILYKVVHNRVAIDLNHRLVTQLTSYTTDAVIFHYMTSREMSLYVTVTPKNNYKMIQQTDNLNYIGISHHMEKHNSQR